MAATAGRDCLYGPRGRMRVSVYKEPEIDYSTRTRGLRFGDKSGALSSYSHLCNYLTRTESLRLRLKRCRPSCTAIIKIVTNVIHGDLEHTGIWNT